jgi:VWFA-related protein
MNLKTIAIIASLAAVSVPAFAQSSSFGEVMEVRITNVDVIVTGKGGKPVPGLKVEDFELYEDGVKKEITNFLEIHEDAPPALTAVNAAGQTPAQAPVQELADLRRRQIVILLDNASIHPFHRNDILPFLGKFVKQNVRKGDELAIITWASSLKAELEPTSDFSTLDATLKRVAQGTTLGSQAGNDLKQFQDQITFLIRSYRDAGLTPPWREAVSNARAYAMSASDQTRRRSEALKIVARSMRGAPGRKILVFVTENFSSNPAEGAFAFLDSLKDLFAGVDRPAMTEARDFEITGLIREVADAANSSGVTLYPIDVGGKFADTNFADASESRLVTATPVIVAQTANMTMNSIAADTGGVSLYGSTNWQFAFDTISNDLNTYYSLGYRSTGEKKDSLKNIEVRLRNEQHYSVRTRHAVIEPSPSSEMNDAVVAHLFREAGGNDLSVRATAGAAKPGQGDELVIPLTLTIPLEKLTLVPDGTDLTGSFSVFAAFLRGDGAVSKVARQPQNFRFPADSLKRRKELTVKIDLKTDPRTGGISIGVMDEASRATGFVSVKLTE